MRGRERLELGARRCRGRLEAQRVAASDVDAIETQKMQALAIALTTTA